jgi:hypothetical protein
MLMLTHTRILRMFLGSNTLKNIEPDLFIHNVSPDLLHVHKDITPDMTHTVERFRCYPEAHKKAAFVQFHLLVDDIAHHGRISKGTADFDSNSEGYAYRRGRPLIGSIRDFHNSIGRPISYDEAAYRSHIIVEMAFDQALQDGEAQYDLDSFFLEALNYTVSDKMDDFCRTSSWLYGIREETIAEAIEQGREKYMRDDSAGLFASFDGRIALYINKFGLDYDSAATWSGLKDLLHRGTGIVKDDEGFLTTTISSIREAGFTSPL